MQQGAHQLIVLIVCGLVDAVHSPRYHNFHRYELHIIITHICWFQQEIGNRQTSKTEHCPLVYVLFFFLIKIKWMVGQTSNEVSGMQSRDTFQEKSCFSVFLNVIRICQFYFFCLTTSESCLYFFFRGHHRKTWLKGESYQKKNLLYNCRIVIRFTPNLQYGRASFRAACSWTGDKKHVLSFKA